MASSITVTGRAIRCARVERPAARAPELVGDGYRVRGELDTGGMGVVMRAESRDGRPVALKLLRPEFVTDATLRERLRREARAVALVVHPNVVALVGHGEDPVVGPYLAFEHLEGETLQARLSARVRLPAHEALDVMSASLAALEAAHNAGVVHRDLKPGNVFLARVPGGEQVKVLDFGISRIVLDHTVFALTRLTRPGLVVGTPAYMAPEQALGEGAQDHRVDVYAAGVVLYEMLTGALPHPGENYNQVLAHALTRDAVPLATHDPGVDPGLAAIVHKAIAREPAERYTTAAAFASALVDWRRRSAARGTCETLTEVQLVAPPAAPRIEAPGATSARVTAAITRRLLVARSTPGHASPTRRALHRLRASDDRRTRGHRRFAPSSAAR